MSLEEEESMEGLGVPASPSLSQPSGPQPAAPSSRSGIANAGAVLSAVEDVLSLTWDQAAVAPAGWRIRVLAHGLSQALGIIDDARRADAHPLSEGTDSNV
jgi:hypothetical protein